MNTQPRYVVRACWQGPEGSVESYSLPEYERLRKASVGYQSPDFWGVYRNEDDGTQTWVNDATYETALRLADELNNKEK